MEATQWKLETVNGVEYRVPEHVRVTKLLGKGAYASVVCVEDAAGQRMAVKKVSRAFHDLIDGKRILREIKLMQLFKHRNLTTILDLYPPEHPEFDDIYIVMDLMESTLDQVIRSPQKLDEDHHCCFTYQILEGLLYVHRAKIVHRDLKPANILVNRNCDVKICDFNLAQCLDTPATELTEYVVTRPYRAPEVVLDPSRYTTAIDIWAVGCILCELVGRRPIFFGKDHIDQLRKVFAVIGKPTSSDLDWLPADGPAHRFVNRLPKTVKRPWVSLFPDSSVEAHEAMEAMLTIKPVSRISAADAMLLTFFAGCHCPDDEPEVEPMEPVDWSFDNFTPTKRILQHRIYEECIKFHPWIADRDADFLRDHGVTCGGSI